LVYKPNHPNAMTTNNWKGYVYEHILNASEDIGRPLREDEEVHHLDFNRSNNNTKNLLVLHKFSHGRLHKWLEKGAPMVKAVGTNPMNSRKPKVCKCGNTLYEKNSKYCSISCLRLNQKS
jgi:hypothetical protein